MKPYSKTCHSFEGAVTIVGEQAGESGFRSRPERELDDMGTGRRGSVKAPWAKRDALGVFDAINDEDIAIPGPNSRSDPAHQGLASTVATAKARRYARGFARSSTCNVERPTDADRCGSATAVPSAAAQPQLAIVQLCELAAKRSARSRGTRRVVRHSHGRIGASINGRNGTPIDNDGFVSTRREAVNYTTNSTATRSRGNSGIFSYATENKSSASVSRLDTSATAVVVPKVNDGNPAVEFDLSAFRASPAVRHNTTSLRGH